MIKQLIVLTTILVFLSASVLAAPVCGPTAKFRDALMHRYKEAPTARGIISDIEIVEIWRTLDGSTFSIVISSPSSKLSCVVAIGTDWKNVIWDLRVKGDEI